MHFVGFMRFGSVFVLRPFDESLYGFVKSKRSGFASDTRVSFSQIGFAFSFDLFCFVFIA